MNHQIRFRLLIGVLLALLVSVGAVSAQPKADPNAFFKMGDYRDIEVMVPKQGYVGVPSTGAAYPVRATKMPVSDQDFDKRYLRATVTEVKRVKNAVRVSFRIDRMDPNRSVVFDTESKDSASDKPLYYLYLFISPTGCIVDMQYRPYDRLAQRWIPSPSSHLSIERPGGSSDPSPFKFTWNPALSPHKEMRKNSQSRGSEVMIYDEMESLDEGKRLRTSVRFYVKPDPRDPNQTTPFYYSRGGKRMGREKNADDDMPVRYASRETQIWSEGTDWLWQEMERTDAQGHVIMRCRRMK